ncbi:DUF6132 family protein [Spirosoma pollinicola]|uniref:YtxH domain-containing protein n=1 Tax=Spirosoma pollinicola TaxID=2057025 RepID=A0A2K8YTF8_9BACT|nr:DUF6132 family protein [Spirosoma pollinicola]AUD00897.1 hypothetical protein CWM47_03140 [Spirosoma pollinicola]
MKRLSNYKWGILGALAGAVIAFFYWKEIGCVSGTCPIKSNWQTMIPYGMLMGYLVADLAASFSKQT